MRGCASSVGRENRGVGEERDIGCRDQRVPFGALGLHRLRPGRSPSMTGVSGLWL